LLAWEELAGACPEAVMVPAGNPPRDTHAERLVLTTRIESPTGCSSSVTAASVDPG
jgi:hypothetical protein